MAQSSPEKKATIVILAALALGVPFSIFVVAPKMRERRALEDFTEALRLEAAGNAEKALETFTRVAQELPHTNAGERAAREAERLRPYCRAARLAREEADKAFKEQRYEDALLLYQRAAESYPLSRRAAEARTSIPSCRQFACRQLQDQAEARAKEGRWREVERRYKRILAIDLAWPGAEAGRHHASMQTETAERAAAESRAHEAAQRHREALAAINRALAIMPNEAQWRTDRTRILTKIPPPEGMVLIAPGEFIAGLDEGNPGETPKRTLDLDAFYMDRTEVTNADYARFVSETGYRPPRHWGGDHPPSEIADVPVVNVSWNNAAAYAQWAGKRLPTGIEWERAARGRLGNLYPWGNTLSGAEAVLTLGPAPVGSAASDRTAEGCADMGGNVAEWTADETPDGQKVVRGGSWAGLERERGNAAVAVRLLNSPLAPRAALARIKDALAIEVVGSETDFFVRGQTNGIPVFEVRKWLPEHARYASARFGVRVGEKITADREVSIRGPDGAPVRERVSFDAGVRVVEIRNPESHDDFAVICADKNGVRRVYVKLAGDPPPVIAPDAATKGKQAGTLEALAARPLAESVRATARMTAPPEGEFINVGFRCVRNLEPGLSSER